MGTGLDRDGKRDKQMDNAEDIIQIFHHIHCFEENIQERFVPRGNVTPAVCHDVMSNLTRTVKCPSLVQSCVLLIPKISVGNIMSLLPAVQGECNVMQYLGCLGVREVKL